MGDERFVEMQDFNGLGERVNNIRESEAACHAEMVQRHVNTDKRMDNHSADIQTLFKSVEGIQKTVNRAMGGIAVLVAGLSLLTIIIEHFWR